MGNFQPVEHHMIEVGSPISQSIFLKSGDLLFKSGRTVMTDRQKKVLVAQGYIHLVPEVVPDTVEEDPVPEYAVKYALPEPNETVFKVKERWLGELYHIFKLSKSPLVVNFSYQIIKLANEIQWVCEYHPNGILAAFHIDSTNDYGLIHALHCGIISEIIAKQSELTRSQRLSIIAGALTHDLGMAKEQTALHEQTTDLTDEQWQELARHPSESYKRLIELGVDDKDWLDIALHHHERIDGSGYPHKLSGELIPLSVRIMSVADTYTALVRPTGSRVGNSGKRALVILYKERGVGLETGLIDILINVIGIYPIGALVRLSTKELGVVIKCGKKIAEPKVSVLLSNDLQPLKYHRIRDTKQDDISVEEEVALNGHLALIPAIKEQWNSFV
ncbi:MAG: HD domain-containing protein [Psychrobium sp.]|nr:HD domain-containing protein [Psychrobium sp.]